MDKYSEIVLKDVNGIIDRDIDFSRLKNSIVLVTGGGGFIGKYILFLLTVLNDKQSYNMKILAIIRNKYKLERVEYLANRRDITILEQDVCDSININYNIDYIIHGASIANPGEFSLNPVGTLSCNIVGTFNLLNLAVKSNVKRFGYLSSALVYRNFNIEPAGSEIVIKDGNEYPLAKFTGEALCAAFYKQFNLECISYRLIGIYGPGYPKDFNTATIEFCNNVINNQDIQIKSDGKSISPHCYVADAIDCIFRTLLHNDNIHSCDVFGLTPTLSEWAYTFSDVAKKFGNDIKVNVIGTPTKNTNEIKFDCTQLESIGWKNRISLYEGVVRMIDSMWIN